MSEYRESVHRLMKMNSEEFISNGQSQHAAVLFECFFIYAKHTIKILCEKLDPEVFDRLEVMDAAADALRRGVQFEVIVQNAPPAHSQFAALLKDALLNDKSTQEKRQVFYVPEASRLSPLVNERHENFAVMDSNAVRYESDRKECKAVATMNRPDLADKLSTIFLRLKSSLMHASRV